MKAEMSYVWKGVVIVFVMLIGFVSSGHAFPLGDGSQEQQHVEPTVTVFDMNPVPQFAELGAKADGVAREGHGGTDQALLGTLAAQEHLGSGGPGGENPWTIDLITAKAVTLRAAVREPSGPAGRIDFTFEIEDALDAPDDPAGDPWDRLPAAVLPQMVAPRDEQQVIPEPSMIALVGLGVLGMIIVRTLWQRFFL
jgi:hypothetical protein